MDKFCSKCGSKLDEKTGLCPFCNDVGKSQKCKFLIRFLGIIVAVAIISAGGLFLFRDSFNNQLDTNDISDCEEAVTNFLSLYQKLDGSAAEYLADRTDEIQYNGIQAMLAKKMKYTVGKVKQTKGQNLVSTQITTVDFKEAFETVSLSVDDSMDSSEIIELLYDEINSDSVPIRTFSIDIPVIRIENEYKIQLNYELSNALFGGFNEYLSELTGEMLND